MSLTILTPEEISALITQAIATFESTENPGVTADWVNSQLVDLVTQVQLNAAITAKAAEIASLIDTHVTSTLSGYMALDAFNQAMIGYARLVDLAQYPKTDDVVGMMTAQLVNYAKSTDVNLVASGLSDLTTFLSNYVKLADFQTYQSSILNIVATLVTVDQLNTAMKPTTAVVKAAGEVPDVDLVFVKNTTPILINPSSNLNRPLQLFYARGTATFDIAGKFGQTIDGGKFTVPVPTSPGSPVTIRLTRDPENNMVWVRN